LRLLATLAPLLSLAVIAAQLASHLNRPVDTIRVDGDLQRLSVPEVAAGAGLKNGDRLLSLNLADLRERVETLPWVAHAEVRRAWPDRVVVSVVERQPIARWASPSSGNQLIDQEGRVFLPPPAALPADLPKLSGPEGQEAQVLAAWQGLTKGLAGGPLAPSDLRLDERGSWTAQTVGGITLQIGQTDPASLVPLLAGAVTRSLAARIRDVAYVDLRYPNGFAVGWRSGAVTAPPAAALLQIQKPAANADESAEQN
jgi:cell division protein FtsQ